MNNDHRLTQPVVDTHAHVFTQALKLDADRRYAPTYDAKLEDFLRHLDANAIGNAVLVQPSFLGTDNSYMLQALAEDPQRLRGVAVLPPQVSDETLHSLNEQGITGVRLNLIGRPPEAVKPDEMALWRRFAQLGWHVELHREAAHLGDLLVRLLEAEVRVVVDHFGRPDPHLGVRDAGFKTLLGFADSGRVWVKLSGAYRCAIPGTLEPGRAFAREASDQLLHHFGPEHLMWGSDWPHTQFERATSYGDTLETIDALDLDDSTRASIMRTTPNAFYGFGSAIDDPPSTVGQRRK